MCLENYTDHMTSSGVYVASFHFSDFPADDPCCAMLSGPLALPLPFMRAVPATVVNLLLNVFQSVDVR